MWSPPRKQLPVSITEFAELRQKKDGESVYACADHTEFIVELLRSPKIDCHYPPSTFHENLDFRKC